MADECKRRGQLGASFIFSRNSADQSQLGEVFTTIAEELSRIHEPYGASLAAAIAKEGPIRALLPVYQFERLIINPLERCQKFTFAPVIIIDALDECKDDERISTLLDILHQHLARLKPLKFFITSRPEVHIRNAFTGGLEGDTTLIALHDIDSQTVDMDIEAYLRKSLREGARAYGLLVAGQWPSQSDIIALVKRSGQLFIYATTVIRVIFDPVVDDPNAQLRRILESSGMEPGMDTLEQLYLFILISASPEDRDREKHRLMCKVLGAILVLADSLSPTDLERLLGLRGGQVRMSLMRLHSVLVVPDTPDPIRVIHKSFVDFLTTRSKGRFQIDAKEHSSNMAIRCLSLMNDQISELSAFGCRGLETLLTEHPAFNVAQSCRESISGYVRDVFKRSYYEERTPAEYELLSAVAKKIVTRLARNLPSEVADKFVIDHTEALVRSISARDYSLLGNTYRLDRLFVLSEVDHITALIVSGVAETGDFLKQEERLVPFGQALVRLGSLASHARRHHMSQTEMIDSALQYACRHWVAHVCQSDGSDSLLKALQMISQDFLFSWVVALLIMEPDTKPATLPGWEVIESFLTVCGDPSIVFAQSAPLTNSIDQVSKKVSQSLQATPAEGKRNRCIYCGVINLSQDTTF